MVAIENRQQPDPMARKVLQALRFAFMVAALATPAATLGGCSTTASDPVGIGTGPDRLKESPCACTEIPQVPFV